MARTAEAFDIDKNIPRQFGEWMPVPGVRIVEPPGSDTLSHEIYNQEIGRGYVDRDGHVIMLLIAYGASQSDRLQLHRPEICYTAQGFRVSKPFETAFSYRVGLPPMSLMHLVAQREGRVEPVSYWMRIGNDVATGIIARQVLKLKYGLRGFIPDGALIRVSTVGVSEEAAFALEAKFIEDLMNAVDPAARNFLVGDPRKALS